MDSDAIEKELANLAASLPSDGQLSLPDENILEQAINMDQQAGYADMVEPSIDPIGLALAESENVTDLDLSTGIPGFPEISGGTPSIQDSKVVAESLRQILMEQSNIDLPVEQIEGLLPSLAQLLPGICQSVAASTVSTAPPTIVPPVPLPAPPTASSPAPPPAVPIANPGKSSSNVFVQVLPNASSNSATQIHKPAAVNNTPTYSSFSSISMSNPPASLVHAVPIAPHPSRLSNSSSSFSSDVNHHPRPNVRRIAPATSSSGMLSAGHVGKINVKVMDTPMSSSWLSSTHSYSKPHNILQPMGIKEQHLPNSSTLKNLVDEVMVGDNESEYIDVGGPVTKRGSPLPKHLKDHSYSCYNPVEGLKNMSMKMMPKSYSLIPTDRLSYAPVLPPTSMMLYKLLKVVPKKNNLVAMPISTKSVKLKIEDYQPGLKYSTKRSTGRKCTRTWKYEEGYLSSDESTTDPEDLDLDGIDASMGSASARRSQRNVGRRKQYVDDINVNLSDYEEKGDSEDEQMKARKKRKYEPKPNQDSDGEESSLNTRAGPYSARNVFINPTEGFKYSDLYMDAPVEEANVVEKILSHRIRPTKEAEQHLGETIEEFFIKYKNYSYLHTEWATFSKLQAGDKRFESKMKRYKAKQEQLGVFANIDDEPFNPEYTVADRVIDVARSSEPNGEVVTHYLVKWKALPYEDSTWELDEDVDLKKVELFTKLSTMPPWSELDFVSRPPPAEFKKVKEPLVYKNGNRLRPYQLEGLNWLLFCWYTRQNCILADEMGLGKTIQAISLLISVKDAGIRGPFLIIVPLSTIANWEREFESWSNMNVVIYHGSAYSRKMIHEYELFYRDAKGRIIPGAYKFNALVTTYEVILADNSELNNVQWRVVIIDEAHRLKNKNCKLLEGLKMLNMEFRVLLTGTPLQNNVEELFSLLNFLEPAKFPILSTFMEKFGDLKTEEQVEQLKEILRPMMLRRLKDDVEKGLAPKEETIIEVELTAVQKQYYRAILEHNFSFLSKSSHGHGTAVTPSLLNTMMELRKCCNHPFLVKGAEAKIVSEFKETGQVNPVFNALVQASGKMVLIDKLLTKLRESGHKVLIFSQMVRCLDILEDYLRAKGYLYERIDGGVRGTLRQAAIDRFSKPDSDRFVFLLCTRAGGLGINLTAADTVIIYDSDWNPQNDIQAQARCHRIGQERAVKVYRLITRNSYEREMFDRASMKLGLDRAVLQSMNSQNKDTSVAAQLSKKEIEDLLKKGAYGAVMEGDDDANQQKRHNIGEDSSHSPDQWHTTGTHIIIRFCEEDIDQILERRTKVILIESAGKGSTFSKASFATEGAEDIDLDDPDFWQKWAQKAKLDLNKLANKDNLVVETPRQRKQTRRYGSEHASNIFSLDNDEEPEMAELVPSRGKKGWTKIELFKTERYLLTYGWGQWSRILNALRMKRNRLSERDIENISRTILVYCLSHYKGDEKVKPHIHRLIDPHSQSGVDGSMGKYSRHGFSEDDYIALLAKNPETLFQDESYMKHLRRNATKILLRTRQLHVIRWQMLEPFLDKIKKNVHYNDLGIDLTKCEDEPPALWWDDNCDQSLLVGIIKHGYEQYGLMRTDDALCFKKIAGPEKPVTRKTRAKGKHFTAAQTLSVVGEGSAPGTPMGSSFGGSGADEDDDIDEDSNTIEDDDEYNVETVESMPERIPKIKRTPVQAAIPGMHIWPTVADLNTRARRLVTHFLKCQKQEEQRQAKLQRIKEKKEREKEVSRKKMLKRMEQAEKWSKREEQDFSRVISFYGVERNLETSEYDWSKFRQLANLARKPDDKITAYYLDFRSACRRVCNKLKPKRGSRTGHLLEPISEERAMRCLQRIDLLSAVREELLPHPKFDELLSLCEPSFEVPQWWIPVQHDRDLLAGVAKHGLYRSEILIYGDPTLSFKETVPTSTFFAEPPVKEPGVSKERSDAKSESDETSLISPTDIVNSKTSSVDINVPPVQQQCSPGEEVNKDCEHQSQDTNQDQQSDQEHCNHNHSPNQIEHDSDCQQQQKLNIQTQSDQQPSNQDLIQTNQDQNEVIDALQQPLKQNEEPQAKQLTSDSQQTQSQSSQSSQQSEQQVKEHTHEGSSSSTTTNVTTPSEPQTPNKIKALCNTPVPIGWPKEKAIVMRINKIVFAFRNGVWPKPMEGLNMFQPLVQVDGVPMEQSSSSEWSDSESMDSPSASDTDLNSEPEQNVTSRTNDSAMPLEINQSGILSSKVKEIKAVSRTLAIEDKSSTGGLQKSPGIKLILKKVPAETSSDPMSLEIKIPLVKLNFSSVRGFKKIPKLSRKRTNEDRGDGVDEDYMPYSKKAHASFQRSPALVQECYTAQEVISDGLPSYSFRNRSEKRSKESLWSKDKDWSPDVDMEYSDASED